MKTKSAIRKNRAQLALARKKKQRQPTSGIPKGGFKIDVMLSDEHLSEYLVFLRRPDTTHAKAEQWLREHNYDIGGHAVRTHTRTFRETLVEVRYVAMLANEIVRNARESGSEVSEASSMYIEQQLMQSLLRTVKAQKSGAFNAIQWHGIVKLMGDVLKNQLMLGTIRKENPKPKKPFDGNAIAAEMRRQLGIPPFPMPKPLPMPPDPVAPE